MSGTWRTGRKLGRTLYRDEVFVGTIDTAQMAGEIAHAMNARGTGIVPEQWLDAGMTAGARKERARLLRSLRDEIAQHPGCDGWVEAWAKGEESGT